MELFFILPFISFVFLKITYVLLLKKNVIDIPNARSMHDIPKIRGGGIAIIILFTMVLIITYLFKHIEAKLFYSLFLGAIILGVVGWIDDVKSIRALYRLILHIIAAIIPVVLFKNNLKITIGGNFYTNIIFLSIFYSLYISWFINLYNFMDGLDGLAVTQLIVPSIFLILLFYFILPIQSLLLITFCMILIALPFYYFNWHPSKMFMGDVLSGFLGFYFAVISLYLTTYHRISFFLIPILLSFFIFDASYTLIMRIFKKEKIWEAHNNHIYQLAAKKYGHKKIAIFVMIYNFLMFIPGYLIVKYTRYDYLIITVLYFCIILTVVIEKYVKNKIDI